jgi:hypothetical protein
VATGAGQTAGAAQTGPPIPSETPPQGPPIENPKNWAFAENAKLLKPITATKISFFIIIRLLLFGVTLSLSSNQ